MDLDFELNDYNKVIVASALIDDLKLLIAGDATEIGEKGINLSGGQRARVCIARSFYKCINNNIDLLLLDDPLSALDNDVATYIFNNGILKLLHENNNNNLSIVIVLNSHLQFLDYFDRT
eukprot:300284_1